MKKEELIKASQLFLNLKQTANICQTYREFILDVVERARRHTANDKSDNSRLKFVCSLSIAVTICPQLKNYAVSYLKTTGRFLPSQDQLSERKVGKVTQNEKQIVVEYTEAVWRFVRFLGRQIQDFFCVDQLLAILDHYKDMNWVVWLCADSVANILSMSSSQRDKFLESFFPDEKQFCKLKIRHYEWCQLMTSENIITNHKVEDPSSADCCDLVESVVMVAGILLPKLLVQQTVESTMDLIPVESMISNLHSLALAVSSGSPVLLQGPVGSGKTSLVEHLARITGRHKSPHLMKIQLGDQTDSKALLGTYRCTDIPGEFTWQAGVLTRAVREGHWVLLEDIDYAPMDVISVLLPLLERNTLTVPGHGDNLTAAPGFQLFATQRLLGTGSGWHRQQSGSSVLLEKMWTKINVKPLTANELQEVIQVRFPQLSTVIDKLLDVYFMLSASKHDVSQEVLTAQQEVDSQTVGKFLSHDGRLISTRDFMNWCSRIARDFDVSSSSTANLVLQEALDCFVSCIPKVPRRILVAEAIGAKLNVNKIMAEYFCIKYKPDLKITPTTLTSGRVQLDRKARDTGNLTRRLQSTFSFTRQSSAMLEKVAVCIARNEPVLLVGETGTGKTSCVQYLAEQLGNTLKVINMNQQSDSSDLLGGFKPVDMKHVVRPFREDFEVLFCDTFSRSENIKFLGHLQECFARGQWSTMLTLMDHTITPALKRFKSGKLSKEKHDAWTSIRNRLQQLKVQIKNAQNTLAFAFIEGTLVKAVRNGDWVLLDEINLAAAETLECLSGLLESTGGSVVLTERGDVEPVIRHPDFRLFACMNPATDVGKKDLPIGIRNRFTEFYVDELEETQDLKILVSDYLKGLSLTPQHVDGVVKFYKVAREEASKHLTDGTGHKPHYSLRTLCRALKFAGGNPCGQTARSLYEGFCLSFLTQLDRVSHPLVETKVCQHIVGKANVKAMLKAPLPMPSDGKYLNIEGYWISMGTATPQTQEKYILTPSVRENLKDLSRVVSAGQHPVLIQGETSVGKTSLVTWLAQVTGNVCVRVNNHEHTDLQEYVGSYSADEHGKLIFKEGVLVEAMRKGYWVILDELNLAPSDVLEALNRLLDDNRELFIPETQEMVRAHSKFMLFATQNPPGHYGGRKLLSRAFRNRFVELHFDQIPSGELETILHQRCDLPMSYSRRLVATMLDLQTRRRGSGVFAGKQGFMTLRDLFRWAQRYKCKTASTAKFYDWDQHMADHGYMLLSGRVRKPEEVTLVQEVIQKHLKRSVDADQLFTLSDKTSMTTLTLLKEVTQQTVTEFGHIVWTYSMRRLAVLIGQAIQFNEPVLLVGDTGCGKTTICQLYAALNKANLNCVNCHLHTESADFLGGLRPCRSHESMDDGKEQKLFEWVDGPLVNSMRGGSMFLIDEISLADDSVLERLNSVLEPERTLLLAEKGGGDRGKNEVDIITAKEGFLVFATMNPGGDFGKKELSPALRNRFTEIWCPQSNNRQDLTHIIEHNLRSGIHLCNQEDGTSGIGHAIMDFIHWFSNNDIGKRCTVSIRDILSWVSFINTCSKTVNDDAMETASYNKLDPAVAFIHGACLVFLDGLGSGTTSRGKDSEVDAVRNTSLKYLLQLVSQMTHHNYNMASLGLIDKMSDKLQSLVMNTSDKFCVSPFEIKRGNESPKEGDKYALQAPTTCVNAQRILRALQLTRPLLLEGSPGVGKTSLVSAIAKAAGQKLVRINLSEQTDVTDLFGADLPVEGQEGGVFAWRDGPFLQALKAGHWIVLDELNLASQSVLEGLNACLDHRSEVYVPELGKTFHIHQDKTRLFACQNPLNQGGGRKGLPRSFLNRFTQVYVEPLSFADLLFIATTMYPMIPETLLTSMVKFNMQIHQITVVEGRWGQKGSPWEFNLRDLFRWCDLLLQNQAQSKLNPGEYVGLLYQDRMRTLQDKAQVQQLYKEIFPEELPFYVPNRHVKVTSSVVQAGHSFLPCQTGEFRVTETTTPNFLLHHSLSPLESVIKCVEMKWMSILVGPQSSGKTSLIQLLSQLSGHPLSVLAMNSSMDTTELLGGFEQADVRNQVDELAAGLGVMVTNMTIRLLEKHHLHQVRNLQRVYNEHRINTGDSDNKLTSVEELQLLRNRVSKIKAVLMIMKEILQNLLDEDFKAEQIKIEAFECDLDRTQTFLQTASPGSGGGAFHWVDSVLVNALEEGHWLLIDNVNFCSASVLDRLNALLEPNGVLSINERGVIDGCIPTIEPHPNFRLFLAMDPKFGEISRAMRNRGVEIYIPGEDDGCPYSKTDVMVMLKGQGMWSTPACDWLYTLHGAMRNNMSRGERPIILDLLHAALVTKQQMDRGTSLVKALMHASSVVYVKSIKSAAAKQIAVDLWEEQIKSLVSLNSSGDDVTSILDYLYNRDLTNIRLNASTIISTLNSIVSMKENNLETGLMKLLHAGTLFLNMSSGANWQLHYDWLASYLTRMWKQVETKLLPDQSKVVRCCLDMICTGMQNTMENYRQLGTISDLKQFVHLLMKDHQNDLLMIRDNPQDLRWNSQCLNKVFVTCDPMNNADVTLHQMFNRLHILHIVTKQIVMEEQNFSRLRTYVEGSSGRLHTYVELVELHHLFTMETELLAGINSLKIQNYDDAAKILNAMLWRRRLLEACPCSVGSNDRDMNTLSLYWNWFYNKGWSVISESMPPSMHSVVNQLHSRLGENDAMVRIFLTFWRAIESPAPYKYQEEAELTMALLDIARTTDLEVESVDMVTEEKVQLLIKDGSIVRDELLNALALAGNLSEENRETINSKIQKIKDSLRKYELGKKFGQESEGSVCVTVADTDAMNQSSLSWQHVQLWPLFGFSCLLYELSLISNVIRGGDCTTRVKSLTDFCLQFTSSSPTQILLYQKLQHSHQAKEEGSVLMAYNELFKKLCCSPAVNNTNRWLQWNGHLGEDAQNEDSKGSFALHMALISHMMFSLLCGSSQFSQKSKISRSLQPLQVSLSQIDVQKDKLGLLSSHLWSQGMTLPYQDYAPSTLERRNLLEMFVYFLKSSLKLIAEDQRTEFTYSLNQISQLINTPENCLLRSQLEFCGDILSTNLPHCQQLINKFIDLIGQAVTSCDLVEIGSAWVYLGLLYRTLLTPTVSFDPVEKISVKLQQFMEELKDVQCELQVYSEHHSHLTGQELTSVSYDLLHPRIPYLVARVTYLQQRIQFLEEQQAFRPQPSQFKNLLNDIKIYVSSVGSVTSIVSLLEKLRQSMVAMTTSNFVSEEKMWQKTHMSLLNRLEKDYPLYKDFVVPFTVAVRQVMHGIRLVAGSAQQHLSKHTLICEINVSCKDNIEADILNRRLMKLSSFPMLSMDCVSYLDLVKTLTSELTTAMIQAIVRRSEEDTSLIEEKSLLSSLLHACLDHVRNDSLIRKELTSELTFVLSSLFHQFVMAWQTQEEEKRRKEEEEGSMYRYKSKTHGDDRDNDVIEEEEFKENFPTFDKHFVDITGVDKLEDSSAMEVDDEEEISKEEETTHDRISEAEMNHVYQCHNEIFTHLTKARWLPQCAVPQVNATDTLKPALSTYLVMGTLSSRCYDVLSCDFDASVVGGHLVVSNSTQEEITQSQVEGDSSLYDIYHDSNVSEIVQCRPVIKSLMTRVHELHNEWPDHPTLKQLIQISDRIQSFPVTSPVMKFLTGMELLLEKAQEWESNAAKHVSLATELNNVSALIIKWRKLELSCWSQCLDSVWRKHKQKSCKWWFYLYQLIQAYLTKQQEEESNQQQEVMKALKQFIENSTLGDFHIRLAMIRAFQCQLVYVEQTDRKESQLYYLHNLYEFYCQFSQLVGDELTRLRTPIQKELKGFVKISRWTDMNYWALKQTTEKTHRTLHKHMKAFQVVLEQSIKGILSESKSESDPSMWLTEYQDTIKSTNFTVHSSLIVGVQSAEDDALQLQSRLPTLCKRVYKHLSKYTCTIRYNSLIQTVEEFTGEIIETVHELQALEIDQTAEKDKQLSEAKHFNQKKRKALSDLFRYLTLFGLSYRKGLIMLASDANADTSLLVPALDISAMFHDVVSFQPVATMSSLWIGCKQYYYRCIGRRGQFLSALLSPHKELGLGNIERCKGFTEHLMQFLVQSHTQIATTSSHYRSLCDVLQQLSKLSQDEKETILPANEIQEKIESLKDLAVTVIEGLAQFEVLMQSCPHPSGGVTPYPSPFPREELPQIATVKKGDELWTNTVSIVQGLQVKTKEIHCTLLNMSGSNRIWTCGELNRMTQAVHELQNIVPDIVSLEKLFYLPGVESVCAFNNTLNFLKTHICEKTLEFEKWKNLLTEENTENVSVTDTQRLKDIATNVENLIEKLLLVIQTLVKSHPEEKETKLEADQEATENEEDSDIAEGHYTKLLFDKLQEDATHIANSKVLTMVEDLLRLLSHGHCVNQSCIQRVVCILPLLQQYTNLVGYNLLQLLALHRSTGKLLSTLLGVFIELASKGFCTPAEFSDEVGGEGATDFEDIEGGGMGEGEGVKNVSDQIENEDQLDEAQKPGQKEEEETNQPDIPSEENAIEMSEDFDGKMQDLEDADKQNDEEEDDGNEENELDKQMGEVDEKEADKLDEQMWGSEDEGEEEQKEESKEEKGSGDGQEDESRLVANDDNKEAGEDQNKDSKDKEENADDNEDVKPHQQDIDESEYDEDKVDPYHNKKDEEQPPEAMDLPDDLNLDDDEQGDSEEKQEGQGEEEKMEDDVKIEEPEETGETTPEETEDENRLDDTEDNKDGNDEDSNENKDSNEEQTDDKENKDDEDVDVKEDEGEDKPGFSAQDDAEEDETSKNEESNKTDDDKPEVAEHHGKTSHGVQNVEQSDTAQDQAGQTEENQEKNEGTGSSTSEQLEGHQGQSSSQVMQGSSADKEKKPLKRKPGKSDSDRSLGSAEQRYKKLKTVDQSPTDEQNDGNADHEKMDSDLYEHIKDSTSQADAQTLDTATDEQQRQQTMDKEDHGSEVSDDDVTMQEEDVSKDENEVEEKLSSKLRNKNQKYSEDGKIGDEDNAMETEDIVKHEIPGEVVATATVERGPESTIHTALENLHFDSVPGELDIEKLRSELEDQLDTWSHTQSPEAEAIAAEAWHRYEALTSSLSQDLCEQLRLVLEPSQATKLKGDYRTGKRLNMRKVIPYIASQFRKDKIWLRRTKPSKRQYQIMLAIDDSSSMVDNHSKQLAYESLALITNALTLLESGELGICSFGEKVQVLHPLTEQFTTQSGVRLLQQFTFEQKKTKIAQLLKHMTSVMVDARSRQHGMLGNPETSQLLLIVSDGRGLFMEGMETVKTAVRQAREANIFLVFVIIDNPQCRDSILDIKVPVFKDGGMKPEIKSYMDHFPFPFYIILRDINSLPHVLCDALRQWFELVTAADS